MYIRSVDITNIRCIDHLRFDFEEGKEAGWHVIIGENGSGKTTVARVIALVLLGSENAEKVVHDSESFLRNGTNGGGAKAIVSRKIDADECPPLSPTDSSTGLTILLSEVKDPILSIVEFKRSESGGEITFPTIAKPSDDLVREDATVFKGEHSFLTIRKFKFDGWFVAGFGPFRRFRGGNVVYEELEKETPWAKSVVSLFRDDAAFSEIEPWLKDLKLQEFEQKNKVLHHMRNFLNHGQLLPNGIRLNGVSSEGVFFEDSEGKKVNLHDLSDGYRSVLSLTFELIRQLIRCYGPEQVFANIERGEMSIPLPGVVIIDEIDAHLHPTWQTRIGQWFTRYFPQLQFIVTTHSPLICRGCGANGKIFRLAAPNSDTRSREITGIERDRLVYGDILDAYATDLFGEDIERGEEGRKLQEEYRELVYKDRYAMPMTAEETNRFDYLNQLFRFNVDHSRSRVK